MRKFKRLLIVMAFIAAAWISFLFTFSSVYPVANKVEQAARKEVSERNTPYLVGSQIPELFTQAVIQTEDTRFYSHFGIDLIGIGRSLLADIKAKHMTEGGSTLTQQLIRNTIISPERTLVRKFKEIILSVALERYMSKEHILELYLNVVYFGHGAYGAEQASEVYFGRRLNELSLPEWSMLAGLPNAPSAYDPYIAMDLAKQRQRDVLRNLVDAHYITQKQADAASNAPILLKKQE